MKVIYPDMISSISADEENPEYMALNVLDESPTHKWEATSPEARLTLTVNGGANTLFIYATNAIQIDITIRDGGGIVVDTATIYLRSLATSYLELITGSGKRSSSIWYDYPYQSLIHTIELDFIAGAPDIVHAGIIRCGLSHVYEEPDFGVKAGLKSYSIRKILYDGGRYSKKGNIVKTFSVSVDMERQTEFYEFMYGIAQQIGPEPAAWNIISTLEERELEVFADFTDMPDGSLTDNIDTRVSFTLEEVI